MIEELYKIFIECFPNSLITIEEFEKNINVNENEIIKSYNLETQELIGYSIVKKNCIILLCVKNKYHGKGIGTDLLIRTEKNIKDKGYEEIFLGYQDEKNFLYSGVPLLNNSNYRFFTKHQYDNDFSSYDVSIVLDESNTTENTVNNQEYTIINTIKSPEFKSTFLKFLEKNDKRKYDKYYLRENIEFIFCKKGESYNGFCAYRVYKDKGKLVIYDLIAYPNFDLNTKRIILNEIKNHQVSNGISEVCIHDISNPILYQSQYNGTIQQKYWRGSKSIR